MLRLPKKSVIKIILPQLFNVDVKGAIETNKIYFLQSMKQTKWITYDYRNDPKF